MNRPVTCGLPVASAICICSGTAAFSMGVPKGTQVLTSCCISRSMSMMLPLCRKASEAAAWCWNSAKSPWRGGERLQSLDLADDLTVNLGRQRTGPIHQVLADLVQLRVGHAYFSVRAEQQERHNDRASERDQ